MHERSAEDIEHEAHEPDVEAQPLSDEELGEREEPDTSDDD